jgi:superfamily I DNA/RNA helicase
MFDLNSLNTQQRLAVETINGPVLILAGAGTGKTRVITCRIACMIQRGINASRILGVTFTNKAAREMQERIKEMLPRTPRQASGEEAPRPLLCTFHSLCVRILRQHIEKLGYKKNFVIYDETEQIGAVKKILAQISARKLTLDAAQVIGRLSRLKNVGESRIPEDDLTAIARHIRPKYESALHACNAVDFDDLILLTLRLFEEFPEALQSCRDKYRYVMVDEYQDTNAAQFKLVHALTVEHRNLCVVGDDDQSIYGWRGAEIANLLGLEKYYPEVKVIKLEQNYRSTTTILNAANAIIKANERRREKRLWSSKGDGPRIALHACASEEEEAQTIVDSIRAAHFERRVPWDDNAILFRTNAQSRALETSLRQADIRYKLIGGQSFFDRREVRDFLAYLKTLLNPHDEVNLLRIANVPARGLSDATMERLLAASQERKCSVFAAMKNPLVTYGLAPQGRRAVEGFTELVEQTRERLLREPLPASSAFLRSWAGNFLDRIGYFTELRRSEKTAEAAEGRIRNVTELMATLDAQSVSEPAVERLRDFLEEITLDNEREEDDEGGRHAVTLITMHSCKGLEFPHVYIVGMEDGFLPHARSKAEQTVDEERRLFYVAVTRAMQTLTISHCAARKKYGKAETRHPSPFLKDIPPELVEDGDAKARKAVSVQAAKSKFSAIHSLLD